MSARPEAFAVPAVYTGSLAQQAYEAWVDHGRKCAECLTAGRATDSPCLDGPELWNAYTAALGIE